MRKENTSHQVSLPFPTEGVVTTRQKAFFLLGIVALFLLSGGDVLSGERYVVHDSLVWYGIVHGYLEALRGGDIPLWNPWMHGGEPLFFLTGQLMLWDPASLPSVFLGILAGEEPLVIYLWIMLSHMLVVSFGGYLLFNRLLHGHPVALLSFPLLLFSGFTLNVLHQHGVYFAFGYLPFTLYFLHRYADSGRFSDMGWFAVFVGISCQNVYFGYLAAFLWFIAPVFLYLYREQLLLSGKWKRFGKHFILFLLLSACFAAPVIGMIPYKKDLYPAARMEMSGEAASEITVSLEAMRSGDGTQGVLEDIVALFGLGNGTNEAKIVPGLVVGVLALIGILFAGKSGKYREEERKLRLLYLYGFFGATLLCLGGGSLAFYLFYYFDPFVRLIRNTEFFLNYAFLCLLYFVLFGIRIVWERIQLLKRGHFPTSAEYFAFTRVFLKGLCGGLGVYILIAAISVSPSFPRYEVFLEDLNPDTVSLSEAQAAAKKYRSEIMKISSTLYLTEVVPWSVLPPEYRKPALFWFFTCYPQIFMFLLLCCLQREKSLKWVFGTVSRVFRKRGGKEYLFLLFLFAGCGYLALSASQVHTSSIEYKMFIADLDPEEVGVDAARERAQKYRSEIMKIISTLYLTDVVSWDTLEPEKRKPFLYWLKKNYIFLLVQLILFAVWRFYPWEKKEVPPDKRVRKELLEIRFLVLFLLAGGGYFLFVGYAYFHNRDFLLQPDLTTKEQLITLPELTSYEMPQSWEKSVFPYLGYGMEDAVGVKDYNFSNNMQNRTGYLGKLHYYAVYNPYLQIFSSGDSEFLVYSFNNLAPVLHRPVLSDYGPFDPYEFKSKRITSIYTTKGYAQVINSTLENEQKAALLLEGEPYLFFTSSVSSVSEETYNNLLRGEVAFPSGDILLVRKAGEKPLTFSGGTEKGTEKGITVQSYKPDDISLKVKTSREGVLVMADAFTKGWEVSVDHHKAPLLLVNGIYKGVVLQKGEHEITFAYKPRVYLWGLALYLFSLFLLCGYACFSGFGVLQGSLLKRSQ